MNGFTSSFASSPHYKPDKEVNEKPQGCYEMKGGNLRKHQGSGFFIQAHLGVKLESFEGLVQPEGRFLVA